MTEIFPRAFEGRAQREYGRDANIIKTKIFDLTSARDLVGYDFGGSCIWALEASDRLAWIDVRLNDQLRDPLRFRLGMFIRGSPFSRIYVSNNAQTGKTITLFYVREPDVSQIQVVNPSLQFNEIDLTKATVFNTVADMVVVAAAAAAAALASNPNRRVGFLGSLSTNTQEIRVGDSFTGAARGQQLMPGDTMIVSTTEAVFVYTPAGVNQLLTIAWTED